jgi:peptidoglycan biosynthesis protein MviN/MurJ (putative lipid II flippase)
MFLRAGALSLALLVASRLLGLLRESAQAAAFGASGQGDVAVLMLALPDWLAGVLASGALAYVLLPAWARQTPQQVAHSQRVLGRALLVMGTVLAVLLMAARMPALDLLASGLNPQLREPASQALVWSALAVPLALLAALWTTRLQHEGEFVGMYAANLVVNAVVIATLFVVAGAQSLAGLGGGLLCAMAVRLVWLRWRMTAACAHPGPLPEGQAVEMPSAGTWMWAALAAGLPLALPFAARSIASHAGEGALATFNYAWKLVELPLLLAIQLVATLAFPAFARAVATDADVVRPLRSGFALAWTLACAAAAGLLIAAPAVARLLFGWGRMQPEALVRVAEWGRVGAWGLLPQALIAVGLTALAARGKMHAPVSAYAVALLALFGAGAVGVSDGAQLMLLMNVLLVGVAGVVMFALGPLARSTVPWRTLAIAGAGLVVCALLSRVPLLASPAPALQIATAVVAASLLIAVTAWLSNDLRAALRR